MILLPRHLRMFRPMCAIDVETTGTNPRSDRIVEVGVIRVESHGHARVFGKHVHPKRSISSSAKAMEPRDKASAVRRYLRSEHRGDHSATADAPAALALRDALVGEHGLPGTSAELHAELIDIDLTGRFRRVAIGQLEFAFDQHICRPLLQIVQTDVSYLTGKFANVPLPPDARALVQAALRRHAT